MPVAAVGLACLGLGLPLFGLAWWLYHRRSVLVDTPTSTVRSIALGQVELKGTAQPILGNLPLLARYSGQECLRWGYRVEEERTRVVTQTINGRTTTRTETYWEPIDNGGETAPVRLQDETGAVLLDPSASLPTPASIVVGPRGPFPTALAQAAVQGWRPRRLTEWRLPVATPLYVLGDAQRIPDSMAAGPDALVITRPRHGELIISDKTEEQLETAQLAGFWVALVCGLALSGMGAYALTGGF